MRALLFLTVLSRHKSPAEWDDEARQMFGPIIPFGPESLLTLVHTVKRIHGEGLW